MIKFEIGKTYYCQLADRVLTFTTTKRTRCYLFFVSDETGAEYKYKVKVVAPEKESECFEPYETIPYFNAKGDKN